MIDQHMALRAIKRCSIAYLCFSLLFFTDLFAVSLYKWVDSDGNISYQDRPPSAGQKFEEKIFSDSVASTTRTSETGTQLPISLYVSNDCSNCDAVRIILEMNKVPYKQHLIDFNQDIQQALLAISGSNKVPTVVIGEQVIEQLDRRSLENALRLGGHPRPPLIEE